MTFKFAIGSFVVTSICLLGASASSAQVDFDDPDYFQNSDPTNIIGKHFPSEAQRDQQWQHSFPAGWDFYWDANTDPAFYNGDYGQEVGEINENSEVTKNTTPYMFWFDNPHDDDLDDRITTGGACKFHFRQGVENGGDGFMTVDRVKTLPGALPADFCPVRPYLTSILNRPDLGHPVTGRYNTGALTRRDELLAAANVQGATYEFQLKVRDHSAALNAEFPAQIFKKKYDTGIIAHESDSGEIIQQDAIMAYFNGPPTTPGVADASSSAALYISPPLEGEQMGCVKLHKLDLLTPNKRGCRDVVLDLLEEGFAAENSQQISYVKPQNVDLIQTTDDDYNGDTYEFRFKLMLQNLTGDTIYDVNLLDGTGTILHTCDTLAAGRVCAKLPVEPQMYDDTEPSEPTNNPLYVTSPDRSAYDIITPITDLDILSERVSTYASAEYKLQQNGVVETVGVTDVTGIPKSRSTIEEIGADGSVTLKTVERPRKETIRPAQRVFEFCDNIIGNSRPDCGTAISNQHHCIPDPDRINGIGCNTWGYLISNAANNDWKAVKIDTRNMLTYRVTIDPNNNLANLYIDGAFATSSILSSTIFVDTYEPGIVPPSGDSQYEFPTFVIGDNAANVESDVDGWPDLVTSQYPSTGADSDDPEKGYDSINRAAVEDYLGAGEALALYHPGNRDITGAYDLNYYAYGLGVFENNVSPSSRTAPDTPFFVPLERGAAGIEFDAGADWLDCENDPVLNRFTGNKIIGQEFNGVQTHAEGTCPDVNLADDDLVAKFLVFGRDGASIDVTPEGTLRILKDEGQGKIYIPTLPRFKTLPLQQPADDKCNGHLCGNDHWSIEIRAKFLADSDPDVNLNSTTHTSEDAFGFKVFDHIGTYWMTMDTNSVKAGLGGKYVGRTHDLPIDADNGFHTYRFVRKRNDPYVYFFIDGIERAAIPDFKMTTVQRNGTKFRPQDIAITLGNAQQIIPDEWENNDRPLYDIKNDKQVQYSVEIDYVRWSDQNVTTLGDDVLRDTLNDVTAPQGGTNIFNGFAGNDRITGNSSSNILNGGHGDDILIGENGDDALNGGFGDDVLLGNDGADALDGGFGVDVASYAGASQYVWVDLVEGRLSQRNDAVGDTFTNIEILEGTDHNDRLYGNDEINTLIGGDGNDTLFGFNGDDTLIVGTGVDYAQGGAGHDTVSYRASTNGMKMDLSNNVNDYGDHMDDTLFSIEAFEGTSFVDLLYGGVGDDDFSGGDANDRLYGRGGSDRLYGGNGSDLIYPGAYSDADIVVLDVNDTGVDSIRTFESAFDKVLIKNGPANMSEISLGGGSTAEITYNGTIVASFLSIAPGGLTSDNFIFEN